MSRGNTPYRNFIIVGTQRTGSSAIAEAIGAHPNVACGWEWTQHGWFRDKIALAERGLAADFSWLDAHNRNHMLQITGPSTRLLGFRRLFRSSDKWVTHPRAAPALWVDRLEAHVRWLARRSDISVIHIVRRDNVEWIKSKVLARENQAFVGKSYAPARITIDIPQTMRRLVAKDWVDGRLATVANTNPYLRIMYEDFAADERSVVQQALSLLNCDPELTPVREKKITKQSTQPTRDYIENFDALVVALEVSGLAHGSIGKV